MVGSDSILYPDMYYASETEFNLHYRDVLRYIIDLIIHYTLLTNRVQCGPTRAVCVIRSATLYPQNAPCFDPSKIGR